ncbi:MAG: HprK-related kinase A [Phycisphaera sp.]|nr:HprK-related kinase A [Phycisphaera sp.]
MKVGELTITELGQRLAFGGVDLHVGPIIVRLKTRIASLVENFATLYADYPIDTRTGLADIRVTIDRPKSLRRYLWPLSVFKLEGRQCFEPFALSKAFAMFEWGLNWSVMNDVHWMLNIHSAVVERNGFCAILPAPPGSGKSTLCAALVNRGWRLFSDEMALIQPIDGRIRPMPRPINLKNNAIELMRSYAPDAVFGPLFEYTQKGAVRHMRPPIDSVERMHETALPSWVIFPRYEKDSPPKLTHYSKAQTLIRLAQNAFNYSILRKVGFDTLATLMDRCDCYEFVYSNLDDAVETFNNLKPTEAAGAVSP